MEDGQTPFVNWVKTNASTVNLLSIVMLIFAAWAAVEIVTNVTGNEIPPETGKEWPGDDQRTNDGKIIALGAGAGTLGLVLQLLIPRDEVVDSIESIPEDDEEIDEVVDVMMEDIESEEEDSDDDEEESDDEPADEDSIDEGDSLEEGDEVPEDEAEEHQEEDSPEEEEKTPLIKKKF